MAMSTDSNLVTFVPDILQMGIESFAQEHTKARTHIRRELRIHWWNKKGIKGEMDFSKLTESQFTDAAAYLVLWKYALPQLTNWVEDDRFLKMIDFYKARYGEEFEAILRDGVEYDEDADDTVTDDEKKAVHHGRLIR
jgi:hypothetical protein